jgi:Rhodopirellula transposase DDE domain
VHAKRSMVKPSIAQSVANHRSTPRGIPHDRRQTTRFCGRDDTAIVGRQAPEGGSHLWGGRQTVALGLAERRTGIRCLGAPSAGSGRKRWEAQQPQVAQALRQLADAHAQQDPTFRTSLTYTRLTAQAALKALREEGYSEEQLPSPSTMAEVLNRLGFRLRRVVKAKPQKKIKETDAIFDNIKKKMLTPCHRQASNDGVSMVKRR